MSKKEKLILLPGWAMDSSVWNTIAPFLSEKFDLCPFHWQGLYNIDDYFRAVTTFIEKNVSHQESFSLLGWSLGSLLAIQVAYDLQECKERQGPQALQLNQLILVSGTSRFTRDRKSNYLHGWSPLAIEKMKRALLEDKEKTLHNFYTSIFSEQEKSNQNFYYSLANHGSSYETKTLITGLDYLIQSDCRKELTALKTPLLLIQGEADSIVPLGASEYLASQWQGPVNLQILKGAGHAPFITQPESFMELFYSSVISRKEGKA
ncbi:alpha/beta fold hydrolase [Heliorestis acidaminivorans]|uniref:Alpha/beta fold hydrolase n=1 Tax=Heliorestis acidaminivorans TaxID=553427 RepID=A0A6I0EZ39_9FIRM|nr:alpha/beta fold hydrolase [Heliorestis acidaminivorans]KAB2952122.1 alpha/beta fold hydrolase [Heliorestis acidaminivorans]